MAFLQEIIDMRKKCLGARNSQEWIRNLDLSILGLSKRNIDPGPSFWIWIRIQTDTCKTLDTEL